MGRGRLLGQAGVRGRRAGRGERTLRIGEGSAAGGVSWRHILPTSGDGLAWVGMCIDTPYICIQEILRLQGSTRINCDA